MLTWLGAISYPLYLLHANIRWSIQLQFATHGITPNWALPLTLAAALSLATLLHRTVEKPALLWIRSRYRERA